MQPYRIDVPDALLDDLRDRLTRTRFADQIDGTGWECGMPAAYLRDLVSYWRTGYDWRAQERRLNELQQYTTVIDGQTIHFVHARSPLPDALPLIITHGWPGSIVEFLDVIPRLTHPDTEDSQAFHVVAPSLPGYGFSEPPRTAGWGVDRIAAAFVELMAELGYGRYGAQGGDWGAQVTTRIGGLDPTHCAGVHLNMPIGMPPTDGEPPSEADQADLAAMARFQRDEGAYAAEQSTKPHTIGAALDDSPAGLLAWIVEKFRGWSDCDGDPETCFTRDQLITNVMLYWVMQSATSAARLYWESSGRRATTPPRVTLATGVARYPKEPLRWPRSWIERQYNVTRWVEMPRGGHFAAMEQPELFAQDISEFFRTVR